MATQQDLVNDLKAVRTQQEKTAGEIATLQTSVTTLNQKIVDLQAIVDAGGTISQELIDAVAAVKQEAQTVDDLIPDAPATPTL